MRARILPLSRGACPLHRYSAQSFRQEQSFQNLFWCGWRDGNSGACGALALEGCCGQAGGACGGEPGARGGGQRQADDLREQVSPCGVGYAAAAEYYLRRVVARGTKVVEALTARGVA